LAWIEVHQHLKEHRKTRKFKNLMGITRAQAIGHLIMLWLWGIDNTDDHGIIMDADYDDIAIACDYHEDSQLIVSALITAGFLEKEGKGEKLVIHDFEDYIGRLREQKKRHREAQKRYADKSKGSHTDSQADSQNDARMMVTGCANLTVPYLTVPNLDINNNNNARAYGEGNVSQIIETEPADMTVDLDALRDETQAIGIRAVNWAEKNWGRMIPKGEVDSIIAWCDEFSAKGSEEPDAVVIEGLRVCLEVDVRKLNYLNAVLTDWRESGVLTVDQVKAREAERKSQKEHKRNKEPGDKPAKAPSSKYDSFYL
jgi:DnaD/phage-associated family protein